MIYPMYSWLTQRPTISPKELGFYSVNGTINTRTLKTKWLLNPQLGLSWAQRTNLSRKMTVGFQVCLMGTMEIRTVWSKDTNFWSFMRRQRRRSLTECSTTWRTTLSEVTCRNVRKCTLTNHSQRCRCRGIPWVITRSSSIRWWTYLIVMMAQVAKSGTWSECWKQTKKCTSKSSPFKSLITPTTYRSKTNNSSGRNSSPVVVFTNSNMPTRSLKRWWRMEPT
jgi:hypothetical protein